MSDGVKATLVKFSDGDRLWRRWQQRFRRAAATTGILMVVAGCGANQSAYPPGSGQVPPGSGQPGQISQGVPGAMPGTPPGSATAAQRLERAWQTGLQGAAIGAMAGPFGMGGGLVLGLIMGAVTADSYYQDLQTQVQGQMQTEQQKDADLEKQLEEELARQRELEEQLNGAGVTQPGSRTAGANVPVEPNSQGPSNQQAGARTTRSMPRRQPPVASRPAVPTPVTQPAAQPRSGFKNVDMQDMNSDGAPDVWVYHDPQNPKQVVRREEDTDHNGQVDTWSYYNQGQLVRRQVDRTGDGNVDGLFFYKDDKLVREERDEDGNGVPTYRALYQDGRLVKVEKDSNRDGRVDTWSYYDPKANTETVVREERDFNSDGGIDLWSYYESGRLVRRDVSEVGMQHLSAKEQAANTPSQAAMPASLPQS